MSVAPVVSASVEDKADDDRHQRGGKGAQQVEEQDRANVGLLPCLWLAIEAITRISTSTGATAFSAPTNRVPSRPTAAAAAGETSATRMPATRPTMIV